MVDVADASKPWSAGAWCDAAAEAIGDVGNRPLHLAACSGSEPLVTMLIVSGAQVSHKNDYGNTPSFLAKGERCREVIVKLEQVSDPEEVLARLIAVEEQRKAAEGAEAQQTEQEAQAEAQAEEAAEHQPDDVSEALAPTAEKLLYPLQHTIGNAADGDTAGAGAQNPALLSAAAVVRTRGITCTPLIPTLISLTHSHPSILT